MASEYGWTLDQIFQLTTHEVAVIMSSMNRRRKLDMDIKEIERGFQASLHGMKYTPQLQSNADTKQVEEFSKEQDDLATRHVEKKMAEMRARAGKQQGL